MQAVEHGPAESISIEPDWEGFRRWVLLVNKTDAELAQHMAAHMGSEAPELPDEDEDDPISDPVEPGSFDYPDFE